MSSESTNTPTAASGGSLGFWFKAIVWIVIIIVGFMYIRHLANVESSSSPATEENSSAQGVSEGTTADKQMPAPGSVERAATQPSGATVTEGTDAGAKAVAKKPETTPVAVVIVEEQVVASPVPGTGKVVVERHVEVTDIESVPEAPTAATPAASELMALPETESKTAPAAVTEAAPQPRPKPVPEAALQTDPAVAASPAQTSPASPAPMLNVTPAESGQPTVRSRPGASMVSSDRAPQAAASPDTAGMSLAPQQMPAAGSALDQGFGYEPPFPPMSAPSGPARWADRGQPRGNEAAEYAQPRRMTPPSFYRGPTNYPPAYYRGYGYGPRYPGAGYPAQGWSPARAE